MNRTALLACAAVLTLTAGTAVAASAASASSSTHTLVVHTKPLSQKAIGASDELEADKLTKSGKTVGYATESCNESHSYKCSVTVALKGGDLLGNVTFPITNGSDSPGTGKITGGLGSYTGAKGTIKIVSSGTSGTVTLKYKD